MTVTRNLLQLSPYEFKDGLKLLDQRIERKTRSTTLAFL